MRQTALFLTTTVSLLLTALVGTALAGDHSAAAARSESQDSTLQLLMVSRRGCIYCEKWEAEIGEGYNASSEGQIAPILRVDLNGVWPDGIVIRARPAITPTFIILKDGQEAARLEGYPGAHYFYPVLNEMLRDLETKEGSDKDVES